VPVRAYLTEQITCEEMIERARAGLIIPCIAGDYEVEETRAGPITHGAPKFFCRKANWPHKRPPPEVEPEEFVRAFMGYGVGRFRPALRLRSLIKDPSYVRVTWRTAAGNEWRRMEAQRRRLEHDGRFRGSPVGAES
jgi:hypothetical protein